MAVGALLVKMVQVAAVLSKAPEMGAAEAVLATASVTGAAVALWFTATTAFHALTPLRNELAAALSRHILGMVYVCVGVSEAAVSGVAWLFRKVLNDVLRPAADGLQALFAGADQQLPGPHNPPAHLGAVHFTN